MKSKVLKIPHNCYLILTADCNMRCLHCYGSYGLNVPDNELTGEEWVKVIENLSNSGVFFVNISGGEPTVHKDFVKIMEALRDNEIYFMLTTNGVFNQKIRDSIIKAKDYILGVQISLDGPDWKSHGFLRKTITGNSSSEIYDITVNNIKKFISEGIRVSIATCLHKDNIEKIEQMKDMILKLKPANWSISTISISGRAKENSDIYVSENKISNIYWKKLENECKKNNIFVDFVDMPNILKESKDKKIYYECPAAKWFCEIYSNGVTTPCPLSRVNSPKKKIKWDNITEKSIDAIWNGEPFEMFRSFQSVGCDGCTAKDKCDRCPPQSIQWFDDPLMPTPYCIENGEKLCLKNLEILKSKLDAAKLENNRSEYGIKKEI